MWPHKEGQSTFLGMPSEVRMWPFSLRARLRIQTRKGRRIPQLWYTAWVNRTPRMKEPGRC